jgi:hypothetical protein
MELKRRVPSPSRERRGWRWAFRLDAFNPSPSLPLVNEAPFTKGRGLARPEGPFNTKHYTQVMNWNLPVLPRDPE